MILFQFGVQIKFRLKEEVLCSFAAARVTYEYRALIQCRTPSSRFFTTFKRSDNAINWWIIKYSKETTFVLVNTMSHTLPCPFRWSTDCRTQNFTSFLPYVAQVTSDNKTNRIVWTCDALKWSALNKFLSCREDVHNLHMSRREYERPMNLSYLRVKVVVWDEVMWQHHLVHHFRDVFTHGRGLNMLSEGRHSISDVLKYLFAQFGFLATRGERHERVHRFYLPPTSACVE